MAHVAIDMPSSTHKRAVMDEAACTDVDLLVYVPDVQERTGAAAQLSDSRELYALDAQINLEAVGDDRAQPNPHLFHGKCMDGQVTNLHDGYDRSEIDAIAEAAGEHTYRVDGPDGGGTLYSVTGNIAGSIKGLTSGSTGYAGTYGPTALRVDTKAGLRQGPAVTEKTLETQVSAAHQARENIAEHVGRDYDHGVDRILATRQVLNSAVVQSIVREARVQARMATDRVRADLTDVAVGQMGDQRIGDSHGQLVPSVSITPAAGDTAVLTLSSGLAGTSADAARNAINVVRANSHTMIMPAPRLTPEQRERAAVAKARAHGDSEYVSPQTAPAARVNDVWGAPAPLGQGRGAAAKLPMSVPDPMKSVALDPRLQAQLDKNKGPKKQSGPDFGL